MTSTLLDLPPPPRSNAEGSPMIRKGAVIVGGVHTDLLLIKYGNKDMLIVTQYKKLGNMFLVVKRSDPAIDSVIYDTQVLLGIDTPVQHVLAKMLAQSMNSSRPLILTIALKDTSPCHAREVADAVKTFAGSTS